MDAATELFTAHDPALAPGARAGCDSASGSFVYSEHTLTLVVRRAPPSLPIIPPCDREERG